MITLTYMIHCELGATLTISQIEHIPSFYNGIFYLITGLCGVNENLPYPGYRYSNIISLCVFVICLNEIKCWKVSH